MCKKWPHLWKSYCVSANPILKIDILIFCCLIFTSSVSEMAIWCNLVNNVFWINSTIFCLFLVLWWKLYTYPRNAYLDSQSANLVMIVEKKYTALHLRNFLRTSKCSSFSTRLSRKNGTTIVFWCFYHNLSFCDGDFIPSLHVRTFC